LIDFSKLFLCALHPIFGFVPILVAPSFLSDILCWWLHFDLFTYWGCKLLLFLVDSSVLQVQFLLQCWVWRLSQEILMTLVLRII